MIVILQKGKQTCFANISDGKTRNNGQFKTYFWFNYKEELCFKNKERKGGQKWSGEFPAKVGIQQRLHGHLAGVMQNGF